MKAPKAGGQVTLIDPDGTNGVELGSDSAFWWGGGNLKTVPLAGGEVKPLLATYGGGRLDAFGSHVLSIVGGSSVLHYPSNVLYPYQAVGTTVSSLLADADHLYISTLPSGTGKPAGIFQIEYAGGDPTPRIQDDGITDLDADGTHFYWVVDYPPVGALRRAPR